MDAGPACAFRGGCTIVIANPAGRGDEIPSPLPAEFWIMQPCAPHPGCRSNAARAADVSAPEVTTVSSVTATDDALNVVPAPAEVDVFSTDQALVEAVHRHGAQAHLPRLKELGRLAGSPRSARWVEFVDRYPPRLRAYDPQGRRVDEIDHHPAWHRLLQAGVRAGLAATPWLDDAP